MPSPTEALNAARGDVNRPRYCPWPPRSIGQNLKKNVTMLGPLCHVIIQLGADQLGGPSPSSSPTRSKCFTGCNAKEGQLGSGSARKWHLMRVARGHMQNCVPLS